MKNYLIKIKKNSPWKYFFLKVVVLLFLLFIADYTIGNILRYYYFKQESGLQYRTTYAIEKTNEEVLVFGSSRANHHYRPDVFENRLRLSFYNTGRDGNFILYHYGVLKCVLKRYSPKIIILDLMNGEFRKDQESYDRLSSLLPYYKSHPEIRPIVDLRSRFEKFKLLSSVYPYNSSMFTIAIGNTELNKKRRKDIKGYVPLLNAWTPPIANQNKDEKRYELDSTKMRILELFIKDCIQANVRLFIVCSPYFYNSHTPDYSIVMASQIAAKNNIPFLDYSNDSTFKKSAGLFADNAHLNDSGAKKFSDILIDRIFTIDTLLFK